MSQWQVPVLSQRTPALCWEACARMMWQWKYKKIAGYTAKAGEYATKQTGLTELQMDQFYKLLGLRSLMNPKGANLQHALTWSPVIFDNIDPDGGHAMVLTGYNGEKYTIVNPCASRVIDFGSDDDVCAAGVLERTQPQVEKLLGQYMWYW